ncbi:probable BOI-related E3 ubiquitin-protein ligase 2 isoform X1 [Lycium ferocissimum]|uniref:probable BOI-related E3 ubiquitin-protein ligase 2 isoform X1 n=1 Tax=Lycium ferocissimum TaxID=112874 RepID=UPI00281610B6|nr:probable BOI-related E3 ubiquitin-protein ligase 2 isoform X1 [Lycium ferocissimum]
MALPHHHLQLHIQQQQPHQQQQQQSKSYRDMYNNMDGQISTPVAYFNGSNLPEQSQHPPYIPPFQVVGLAPGTADDGGLDLQWNYGLEPKKKRPKEQDFLENNSQISSLDLLQPRSVSTGLGLSLDNGRLASSGDSAFLGLVGDDIERELQRQDAEIDRYIKVQGDRLRQAILEKVQANQIQAITYVEEKVLQKLREKEAEVDDINKKNMELELRMEQLALEANAWQQRAKYNENLINTLKVNLQHVYAQSRDSKEGCGDSEVDDTASCCNGRAKDLHLLCRDSKEMKELMTCRVCRANEVSMLLLPCKHLCLCKECESKLSLCPLCQSTKYIGMEVYM